MPIDSNEQFEKHLARRIDSTYESNPQKPSEKIILLSRSIRYVPTFHTSLTLDHYSYNTTGRAVHHEHQDVNLLIRASQTLIFEDDRFKRYVINNKQKTPSTVPHDVESDGGANISLVVNTLINEMVRSNTYKYTYEGRNGQRYTRTTDPTSRDVYVNNADIIFIVESHIEYMFMGKKYSFDTIETQSPNFYKYSFENHKCDYCNQRIDWDGMICNECGNIIHKTHGHSCNICGKTLCPNCESKYKKFIFLTKYICHNCISMNPKINIMK